MFCETYTSMDCETEQELTNDEKRITGFWDPFSLIESKPNQCNVQRLHSNHQNVPLSTSRLKNGFKNSRNS